MGNNASQALNNDHSQTIIILYSEIRVLCGGIKYAKHIITASIITYVSICFTSIPLISCCTLNGKDMYDQRSKWMTSVRTHLRIQYLFFRGLCLEIKRKERNTIFSSHVFCNSFISRSSLRYFYDNTIIDMFIGKIFFH